MTEINILHSDDWVGLYSPDGNLHTEGHTLEYGTLFQFLCSLPEHPSQINIRTYWDDEKPALYAYMRSNGRCPQTWDEVLTLMAIER